MAKVNVVLRRSNSSSTNGSDLPVVSSKILAATEITSGAAAVVNMGGYLPQARSDIWEITCRGGSVYALWGATPVASVGPGTLIVDGQTRWFGVSTNGEALSIIDAP